MRDRKWFADMARCWLREARKPDTGFWRRLDCRNVAAEWIKEGQRKFPKV